MPYAKFFGKQQKSTLRNTAKLKLYFGTEKLLCDKSLQRNFHIGQVRPYLHCMKNAPNAFLPKTHMCVLFNLGRKPFSGIFSNSTGAAVPALCEKSAGGIFYIWFFYFKKHTHSTLQRSAKLIFCCFPKGLHKGQV